MSLQPENSANDRDAENGHERGGIGKEVGTGDERNSSIQRQHNLLLPAVDSEPGTHSAPNTGSDQGARIS